MMVEVTVDRVVDKMSLRGKQKLWGPRGCGGSVRCGLGKGAAKKVCGFGEWKK